MTPTTGGRALDAEIAEKVMGWTRLGTRGHRGAVGMPDAVILTGLPPQNNKGHPRGLPRYSTDIAAAFQVVEAMRAKDFCASGFTLLATREKVWVAGFAGRVQGADTPALAICLAALAALDSASPEKAAVPSLHRETSIHG